MADCEKLANCPFFKAFHDKKTLAPVLEMYFSDYCRGKKQDICVRKKIAKKFGPEKVPVNMTPAGVPVLGTSKDGWPPEALKPSE